MQITLPNAPKPSNSKAWQAPVFKHPVAEALSDLEPIL
jgi:hypothetical protein